jgi:hypothetical protein
VDRADFRPEPSRPNPMDYKGRLFRGGDMDMQSQQRAAHHYNLKVNEKYFEHQRDNTRARPERHQPAPARAAAGPSTQRETPRDLRPEAGRAPQRAANAPAPERQPARQEVRIALRQGFNADLKPPEPKNQVRRSYVEPQPERNAPGREMRNEMRAAARETLRPALAPERPQMTPEVNRPAPSRGLER